MEKDQIAFLIEQTHKEELEFRSLVPVNGFIGRYMKYTDRQESPGSYHFWVAVSVVGAALQRKVWINKGIYEVYPNLYVVLVGPSGKCRKTRAMALGIDLLEGFDWANVIADKTTPEGLLQAMSVGTLAMEKNQTGTISINPNPDSTGMIVAPELAVFVSKQTYSTGMTALLVTLYDCPPSFKYITRNKSPIILKKISLSMLGASTPEWLASNLPADSFEGGFMSRILFVVRERRDRSISLPENPLVGEKDALQRDVQDIHQNALGEIKMSKLAKDWFDMWYRSVEATPVSDISLLGFVERKPDTILKLSMVLAVSDKRMEVTDNDLRQAHSIISWTQDRMFTAFSHIDLTPLGVIQRKVMEMVMNLGKVSRGDILRKLGGRLHRGVADLFEAQKILEEAGQLVVITEHTRSPGRPAIWYMTPEVAHEYSAAKENAGKGGKL